MNPDALSGAIPVPVDTAATGACAKCGTLVGSATMRTSGARTYCVPCYVANVPPWSRKTEDDPSSPAAHAANPRFRYMTATGEERTAAGPQALAEAVQSGDLLATSMLFDRQDGRWRPADQNEVARIALSGAVVHIPDQGAQLDQNPAAVLAVTRVRGRAVARMADVFGLSLLSGILLGTASLLLGFPGLLEVNTTLLGMMCIPINVALEAICLIAWGATPGKLLLGLRVVHEGTTPLPPEVAWARAWRVYYYGFALGVPSVFLVAWVTALNRYNKGEGTRWDMDAGTSVMLRSSVPFTR
jgi:hypothetical protein